MSERFKGMAVNIVLVAVACGLFVLMIYGGIYGLGLLMDMSGKP